MFGTSGWLLTLTDNKMKSDKGEDGSRQVTIPNPTFEDMGGLDEEGRRRGKEC